MNEERKWTIDQDVSREDNLFDGFTFQDLITSLHCGCENITPEKVWETVRLILDIRWEDASFLIKKNMELIIAAAMEGRE